MELSFRRLFALVNKSSSEQKYHETKLQGSESFREQKFHPWNFCSWQWMVLGEKNSVPEVTTCEHSLTLQKDAKMPVRANVLCFCVVKLVNFWNYLQTRSTFSRNTLTVSFLTEVFCSAVEEQNNGRQYIRGVFATMRYINWHLHYIRRSLYRPLTYEWLNNDDDDDVLFSSPELI